jgi:uncharacterized integral membrane protein (TIGR00698 family)
MSAKLDFATRSSLARLAPGVGLCLGVATLAWGAQAAENALFGKAWVEALVLAILIGAAIRTFRAPPRAACEGVTFAGKRFLEIAVVLLGASVSAKALEAASPILLLGVVGLVLTSIAFSFAVGRVLGLTRSMAMLVACGNSICGNSAIAAVAPVIDAKCDDVAAAIGFTAVFGVAGVLLLPPLGFALGLGPASYGAFAGLTVYAVPQVIAAAAPAGSLAVQTGTLVKLVRVMMLGPVCLLLSLVMRRRRGAGLAKPAQLLPWFIVGFFAVAALKLWGVIPQAVAAPAGQAATLLTVVSMAALGLGVDVRVIARAGRRVIGAVLISLLGLSAMSLALLAALRIA